MLRTRVNYAVYKAKPKLIRWIVWRLPRSVVYWSAIRLMAHATQGKYSDQIVPELTAMDALKRWDEDPKIVTESHGIPQDYADSAE